MELSELKVLIPVESYEEKTAENYDFQTIRDIDSKFLFKAP